MEKYTKVKFVQVVEETNKKGDKRYRVRYTRGFWDYIKGDWYYYPKAFGTIQEAAARVAEVKSQSLKKRKRVSYR